MTGFMNEPFNFSFKILRFKDLSELSISAADHIISLLGSDPFHFVLTGGSTSKALYKILSERNVDWRNVHFWWGDERCVPPDHPDSNFGMAHNTLLSKISVEENRIYRMKGEMEPGSAALEYEGHLRKVFGGDSTPSFDLVLLGMGEDGHIASLFPGTAAPKVQDRLVVHNYVEKLQANRLTMTFPLLNQAKRILFLISGASKAMALHHVLEGEFDPFRYPAQGIRPVHGELVFFMDEAAASMLGP
jgi:6-phosphogluconolactonase